MALTDLLAAHVPTDEKEKADLEEMRLAAVTLKDPFSRDADPVHFTGSAVVTTAEGDRVCLILHKKLKRWLQPGGHAEVGDGGSMEATALREAREETGLEVTLHPRAPRPLDVDIHDIPPRKTEPGHRHLDVRYLVVAANPEALNRDEAETSGAQWLSWDEAIALADEAPLRRLLTVAAEWSK